MRPGDTVIAHWSGCISWGSWWVAGNYFSAWAISDIIVVQTSQGERMLEHNNKSQWCLTVCVSSERQEERKIITDLGTSLYTHVFFVWSHVLDMRCSFFDIWLVILTKQTIKSSRYIVLFCMSITILFLSHIRRATYECLNRVRRKKTNLRPSAGSLMFKTTTCWNLEICWKIFSQQEYVWSTHLHNSFYNNLMNWGYKSGMCKTTVLSGKMTVLSFSSVSSTGWFGDRGFETPNSSLGKEENRMKDTIQVKKTLIKTVLMKSGMSITCKAILSILYQFNIELYCKKFFNHLYFQWNYYRDIKVLWSVVWRWWLFNFIFCFDHKRSFICAGSNYSVVGYFFSSATSEIFHPRENDRSNCVPGWLSSVLSPEWIWAEGQRD